MSSEDLCVRYALSMGDRLIAITRSIADGNMEALITEADRLEWASRALRRLAQRMLQQEVVAQQR